MTTSARLKDETGTDWYGRLANDPGRDPILHREAKLLSLKEGRVRNEKILVDRAKAKAAGTYRQRPAHDSRRSDAAQRHCVEGEAAELGISYEDRRKAIEDHGVSFPRHEQAIKDGTSLEVVIEEVEAEKAAAEKAAELHLKNAIDEIGD